MMLLRMGEIDAAVFFIVMLLGAITITAFEARSQSKATKDEISAAFVEKTATFSDGLKVTYGADRSYKYESQGGSGGGTYDVLDGQICVTFRGGNCRCDTIMKDGDAFTLINRNGAKFPVTFR